jgi:hypothetical protein
MRSRKGSLTKQYKQPTEYHNLYCCECGHYRFTVRADIAKVTCGACVQKIVAPPENYSKQNSPTAGFPRGWHFKKRFEAPNGDVYSFGKLVENIEPDSIQDDAKVKPEPKKVSKKKPQPRRKRTSKK